MKTLYKYKFQILFIIYMTLLGYILYSIQYRPRVIPVQQIAEHRDALILDISGISLNSAGQENVVRMNFLAMISALDSLMMQFHPEEVIVVDHDYLRAKFLGYFLEVKFHSKSMVVLTDQ